MKKLLYVLTIFLVATSCKDDILDKRPLGLITEETVWNDRALIDSYLTQIYYDAQFMENDQNQVNNDVLNN